jgi:hypothetical protein
MAASMTRGDSQVRVVPGVRGGWRVEDPAGVKATCGSLRDAEGQAERLLQDAGGGELFVYDAYLRVRAVKRLGARPITGDS